MMERTRQESSEQAGYLARVEDLFETFFQAGPGLAKTPVGLRQAIEQYAARLSGQAGETATIPPELEAYVTKVALYAYKVTGEDVAGLKALGYTEDELFEITISAALGAGQARLEQGLVALKGA